MLDTIALSDQAMKNCLAHGRKRVQGDLIASINGRQQDWDGVQMRRVFTQSMTLWRRYGKFDVILDADAVLVGFIDHEKYKDPGDAELSREDAETWIRNAGVVPESAKLESFAPVSPPEGEGRLWKAVFALESPRKEYALLEVELNTALKAIACVRPMRREGHRG
jgi:hypothetical protein